VRWSDGSIHWLNSRGNVHDNENGQPQRIIGTTRDISERKQAEQGCFILKSDILCIYDNASF
ncbi:MAG: PAS domain-containing protein, partial [Sphaerospermopsis kisseleviana]